MQEKIFLGIFFVGLGLVIYDQYTQLTEKLQKSVTEKAPKPCNCGLESPMDFEFTRDARVTYSDVLDKSGTVNMLR